MVRHSIDKEVKLASLVGTNLLSKVDSETRYPGLANRMEWHARGMRNSGR